MQANRGNQEPLAAGRADHWVMNEGQQFCSNEILQYPQYLRRRTFNATGRNKILEDYPERQESAEAISELTF